jgi:hypothetical protein
MFSSYEPYIMVQDGLPVGIQFSTFTVIASAYLPRRTDVGSMAFHEAFLFGVTRSAPTFPPYVLHDHNAEDSGQYGERQRPSRQEAE